MERLNHTITSFSSLKAQSPVACSPAGQMDLTEDSTDRCTLFDDWPCGTDQPINALEHSNSS